jgi:hypothetical protein
VRVSDGRLDRLERIYGVGDDEPGQLVIVAPNAWPDADRAAYYAGTGEPIGRSATPIPDVARLSVLSEGALDAIERQTGIRPKGQAGHVCVVEVPAPEGVERADEATRPAWRGEP